MEQDVWNRIGSSGDVFSFSPGMGMLAASGGDAPPPGSFHMPFFGSSLKVGALVEPLTSQMAEYLGVENGLMVKQVASKSEAAAAGMKVFDVILKVGGDPISTLADWDRALRANEGKPVQVTLLRDRKQQTLTLQVDSKRHSELEMEDFFPAGDGMALAWTGPEFNQAFAFDPAQAQALRDQAEALRNQLKGLEQFKLSPEQAEQIRQKAEELSKSFKTEDFKLDPKQMGELKQQMEEFRKSFKPEEFEIDPKSMDQLKQQMEDLKRQMENWKAPAAGGRV
jgi:membrane-associated protease RseP (regulator of RpoE activity)